MGASNGTAAEDTYEQLVYVPVQREPSGEAETVRLCGVRLAA